MSGWIGRFGRRTLDVPVRSAPQVTLYGQPIEQALTQFLGVPCAVCDHATLAHRNLSGCTISLCDCRRTPWDFR